MIPPKIVLATLCLNEFEWLPKLWEQHKDWPGLVGWVFVESADRKYAEVNPDLVTAKGLSKDLTSRFLEALVEEHPNLVRYVPHGFCRNRDAAQGKVEARQRYIEVIDREGWQPDFLVVLDADEFYPKQHQETLVKLLADPLRRNNCGFCFRQRHVWRPASISAEPLFRWEVTGGYWKVPHCRVWRWQAGLRYRQNHNWPETKHGELLNKLAMVRYDLDLQHRASGDLPQCVHLGYAGNGALRTAKHRYYVARGEGSETGRLGVTRKMYVDCRSAYEAWQLGDKLPHGAQIVPWTGVIPEVFTMLSHFATL